jgi:hypothetical protein
MCYPDSCVQYRMYFAPEVVWGGGEQGGRGGWLAGVFDVSVPGGRASRVQELICLKRINLSERHFR